MADMHKPTWTFEPLDLTHSALMRQILEAERLGESEACQHELAHDKRRNDKEAHLLHAPKERK
jgi:hypothetical protein